MVSHGAAPQASQQRGYIKAPAHNPEGLAWSGLPAQEVIEKRMLSLPLAVGDHLHPPLAYGRQKAGGLELHQQATTTEAAAGARHQEADRSEAGLGQGQGRRNGGRGLARV